MDIRERAVAALKSRMKYFKDNWIFSSEKGVREWLQWSVVAYVDDSFYRAKRLDITHGIPYEGLLFFTNDHPTEGKRIMYAYADWDGICTIPINEGSQQYIIANELFMQLEYIRNIRKDIKIGVELLPYSNLDA